jgi:hypothetical protein
MRAIRILHDDEEFYLVDGETEEDGRTITLLMQPEAVPPLPSGTPLPTVPTSLGPRIAVARWCAGRVEPLLDFSSDRIGVFKIILDKYLTDLLAGDKEKGVSYFYHRKGTEIDFSVSHSHPHGLVINVFSRKELALSFPDSEPMQTNNLVEFLTRAANEGYAGAILDDRDPIYFCMDEDEAIHFLRLSKGHDEEIEEIEETLLNADGAWRPLPQKIEIDLYANTEACDRNMIRLLGDIPFLREGDEETDDGEGGFYAIEERMNPGFPVRFETTEFSTVSSAKGVAAVFHDRRSAARFMEDRQHEDYDIVNVRDIRGLLENAAEANLIVMLQPGGHRARGGIFWLNEGEIILDSFSGLWKLGEEKGFSRMH